MNILVTGAKGMVGTALCNNLKNIRDGKNKTRPELKIDEIYETLKSKAIVIELHKDAGYKEYKKITKNRYEPK